MITKTRESNKHEQAPCASCGFPYRDLIVYRVSPNNSAAAPATELRLCRKCDARLAEIIVQMSGAV